MFAFEFTFCIYYFIHNTHITHIISLKKNGLPVRNIGITKYFLPSICCVVILICTYISQTFKLFFASFTYLGSYSHFYIHVIYLFFIIYFIFTSYRPCSVMLTCDWIISYLCLLLNLRFVYTTLYITHTLHT